VSRAGPPDPPSPIKESIWLSTGFPPVAAANARILILGSLPGAESLRQRQYYAKPQNRFWWIMGQLYGAHPTLPYERRLDILRQASVALWDVCHTAHRPGSLDSAIRADTVIPNQIAAFLDNHRSILLIACNGRGAEKLFNNMIVPRLGPRQAAIPRACLPSTSAAHAAMPPAAKLARWSEALGQAM
jgi:hypoxanthine-DNA glycosylase